MKTKFPRHVLYSLNRVSEGDRQRLDLTCDHFNVNEHKQRQLLSEVILRLGHVVNNAISCPLPADERGRTLYRMYKYYDSLAYISN